MLGFCSPDEKEIACEHDNFLCRGRMCETICVSMLFFSIFKIVRQPIFMLEINKKGSFFNQGHSIFMTLLQFVSFFPPAFYYRC